MTEPQKFEIECVGYSIAADLYKGGGDAVLFNLIGYSSFIDKYGKILGTINEQTNLEIITIDYSGHGRSPFNLQDLTPAQHFLEVITAFDWIKEHYPHKKIYVMGASYGGFLATQLTKYREFDNLILRVPAIYAPNNFYTKWKNYDISSGKKYREEEQGLTEHPLLKRASNFTGKTFVITHELDDVCPKNTTMAFVKAFNADHWEAPGFKHGFGESIITDDQEQEYYQKIVEWINS